MTTKRHDLVPAPGFSDDDSAPASNLSSMQRAIVTIQKLRTKVESLERTRAEPIAIVGMGCRFPGGANTPEAFFRLLDAGVDAVSEVPPERWPLERESADSEGEQRSLRWGAFLKDVDKFDAAFFGISPREAESLDPQQRILLEVTWEALERAGQLPERLMGSKTGVFVGIWSLDYQQRVIAQEQEKLDAYCFTGNVLSTAAGRLAYTLGLQGPCMSVETACSSSLTAIHLACQSLRTGESSMALAGGVNLMLSPTTSKLLSKTQALSPDGRCKTFDARANGFVRGEGCGILVLKRLSDAERDGDTVLALIRGSAVNQDGRSTGLTAPNVLSQQALLKQALENARLSPQDIGYVETHGTGTSLGDPIEMEAIKAVLGAPREKGSTCILGAVKTNIGHLEAAAGVAGVIKVILAMQNDKIPGNLHFRSLNPRIDLKGTSLEIAQEPKPWAPGVRPRCAGVSSFGISGTNAHVILEEAPKSLEEALFEEEISACLLPLSAKTPESLRDLARRFHELLTSAQSPRLQDIVHTASARRSHYLHRLSFVGKSKDELATQLGAYLEGTTPSGVAEGRSTPARAKVVFVFSGQGAQWLGMGRQLYELDSSFRSVIDTCDNLMTARLGWSILDELDSTEAMSRMSETQVAQPLLFAVQIALVEMLRSLGIAPDAMIGHSVGEIAAAHIAGILSLDEAIRLVSLRGRIMQKATGMGKMVSVSMSPEQARTIIEGYEDRVSIAAINDPNSVVLAGAPTAIDDMIVRCEKRGFASRPVRVNYAFHSPQMDPFERELVDRLVRVDTRRATLAMYSTVLAECVDGKELDVRYWGRNIRETVDFAGAMSAAIRDGYQLFLEVGPHPVLTANIQNCFTGETPEFMATYTMRRNADQRRTLLEAIGALYTRGCAPEWARVIPSGGKCVTLPTNPWQKERYYIEQLTISSSKQSLDNTAWHPLLGRHISISNQVGVHIWEQRFDVNAVPWIAEHLVQDEIVFPGAGYVEMALSAAASFWGERSVVIQNISFEQMLSPSREQGRSVQFVCSEHSQNDFSFQIASRNSDSEAWTLHSRGTITAATKSPASIETPLSWSTRKNGTPTSAATHYEHMSRRGVDVGPSFQGILEMWRTPQEVVCLVQLTDGVHNEMSRYRIHPALLDACFQSLLGFLLDDPQAGTFVPAAIEHITWVKALEQTTWVRATMRPVEDQSSRIFDIVCTDEAGNIAAEFQGLRVQFVAAKRKTSPSTLDDCLFTTGWQNKDITTTEPARSSNQGRWLLLVDSCNRFGSEIANRLRAHGDECSEVFAGKSYTRVNDQRFVIDPLCADHYTQLLQDTSDNKGTLRGVLHCWSIDIDDDDSRSTSVVVDDTRRIGMSALYLAQALLRQSLRNSPRLIFVTRGAQDVPEQRRIVCPLPSLLWGFGRTLALEHPNLDCLRLDLDPAEQTPDVDAIVKELLVHDVEDQVALRHGHRFVPRIVRAPFLGQAMNSQAIRPDATYLLTGGLGGLGLSVAQWLVSRGARHIALLGRSNASESARAAISNLEAKGASVRIFQADVADASRIEMIFTEIRQQMPPIRGVIHAAGVIQDRTILELTVDTFDAVVAPKVYGAWNLHQLSRPDQLDFFILYSSAASLLGSPGQAHYSAANASMDALAHMRIAMGLPALSIHWGPFSDTGMAAAQANRGRRLEHQGLGSISTEEGELALGRLLDDRRGEVGIMRFLPRQWLEFNPQAAAIPFYSEVAKERDKKAKSADATKLRDKLATATEADRARIVESYVLDQIAQVIRIDPGRIDKKGSFTDLGIDSLMSLELRNRLESGLGLRLASTILFTYASPNALISFLMSQVGKKDETLPTTEKSISVTENRELFAETAESVDAIADDDLLAAFDASIQGLK